MNQEEMDAVDKAVAESRAGNNDPELKQKIKANRRAQRRSRHEEILERRVHVYRSKLTKRDRRRIEASKRRNRR